MNDLTIPPEPPSQGLQPRYGAEALALELGKMLALVAPVTMSDDQQTAWLAAAVDSLQGIYADEVQAISLEIRRSVTRPAQIVPEIAKLVAERRAKRAKEREWQDWVAAHPPAKQIERKPEPPLTEAEIARMPKWLQESGIRCGAFVREGNRIVPCEDEA